MTTETQKESSLYNELKRLRKIINNEGALSWGDIAFLNSHQTEIKEYFPNELLLWQWAGIDETERKEA